MEEIVKVTLALDPDDAARLVDLAGGEAHVNQYAATLIQTLHAESPASNEEARLEQIIADAQARIDLYG
jgi:hypothetical protein